MTTTEAPPKKANLLVNLWDIFTAPSLALRRINAVQPRSWWFPALLAAITPILFMAMTMDLQIAQAKKMKAIQLGAMTPEQAQAAQAMTERLLQPGPMLMTTVTQTIIGLLVAWGFSLLILYFGIALLGSTVKANKLWAALVWIWIPLALRPLAQLVWALATGSLLQYQGLSALVASGDPMKDAGSVLFLLFSQIDIFMLWFLVLLYILLRVVGKLSKASSLILTALYTAIWLGFHLLPAAILKLTGVG